MVKQTHLQLVHIELLTEGINPRRSPSRTDVTLLRKTGLFPDIIRGQAVKGRMSQEPTTPETVLISELDTIEHIIDFVSAKHHLRAFDSADFASHVKLKLVEHDYAILRQFQGRSSLRTYLTVVIQRMFLDYCDAKWGKWRPSAEAKRAGDLGIHLEQLLSRDGYSFEEACELLANKYQVAPDRKELERIASSLPARPRRRFEGDASLADRAADTPGADALVERGDRDRLAKRVSVRAEAVDRRGRTAGAADLVLQYVDGRSVADIASMLSRSKALVPSARASAARFPEWPAG